MEGCGVEGYPSPEELAGADWTPLVERSTLAGDTAHEFTVDDQHRFTHVRLSIYPDGGVARLRVFGEVVADPRLLPPVFDLAALENGGRVLDCSNSFYSTPNNLIKPGLARVMGDGWETARRRDDGNDWVSLQLACAGRPMLAEIDTTHFVGNAPGWASLTGDGAACCLPRTRLQPDTRHRFALSGDEVSQLRLDVYPGRRGRPAAALRRADRGRPGGVAAAVRQRAAGQPAGRAARETAGRPYPIGGDSGAAARHTRRRTRNERRRLMVGHDRSSAGVAQACCLQRRAGRRQLRADLAACCAARDWVAALVAGRPFADQAELFAASDAATAS